MDRFVYTSGVGQPLQAPIRSNLSDLIREAKQKNDSTYWSSMRKVFEEDFKTLPLDRFKAWESTLSVPIMVRGRLHYYMGRSLSLAYKDSEWYKAIEEPMVGMSEQDYYQLFSLCDDYRTTMNRVQQAAHLITCGFSKQDIRSFKSVVELGAGVGDMADIMIKLGFDGKYSIYDFPELNNIQRWYHNKLGYEDRVYYTDDYKNLCKSDLVIATWSFTEMPFELREQLLESIGESNNWLIAYSNQIFGMDNNKYIQEEFIPRFKNHDIRFIDVPFMPWDGGTKYLVIRRNDTV